MENRFIPILSAFILGFLIAMLVNPYFYPNLEHPLTSLAIGKASAPSDFVKESSIEIYGDKVILRIENASLSAYASTGSMRPIFDMGANGLRVAPNSPEEISIGDIITFEREGILIIHRVIDKGIDKDGIYFITRGDNNFYSDGKIRFEDIKYKTIGILY